MNRGTPYLQGQPVRPQPQYSVDAGSDVWLELIFLDRTQTPVTPSTITYRIDDISDNLCVLNTTSVTPNGSTMEINIPAFLNQISTSFPTRSSQLNQVTVVSTYSDGSQRTKIFTYEVIAICTVGGA